MHRERGRKGERCRAWDTNCVRASPRARARGRAAADGGGLRSRLATSLRQWQQVFLTRHEKGKMG
eukprot:640153-Alexandrium_andersonii.AAC.1